MAALPVVRRCRQRAMEGNRASEEATCSQNQFETRLLASSMPGRTPRDTPRPISSLHLDINSRGSASCGPLFAVPRIVFRADNQASGFLSRASAENGCGPGQGRPSFAMVAYGSGSMHFVPIAGSRFYVGAGWLRVRLLRRHLGAI